MDGRITRSPGSCISDSEATTRAMWQSAVELQKRDLAMLGSLLRWGLLPAWYLAAWYFAGSKRTAENRLGLLRRAGYLRRVETWWRGPLVVAPNSVSTRLKPLFGRAAGYGVLSIEEPSIESS